MKAISAKEHYSDDRKELTLLKGTNPGDIIMYLREKALAQMIDEAHS